MTGNVNKARLALWTAVTIVSVVAAAGHGRAAAAETAPDEGPSLVGLLDAPLLFVKRFNYLGIHIYDTFYKWPPGGGGIYLIENPSAPPAEWKIRPIIDPSTPETLGEGVYTDPELSWDATRLLFCFKGEPTGMVCGGMAEWLGWDATLVRVLFVCISVFSAAFPGILVYLGLWLLMPEGRV